MTSYLSSWISPLFQSTSKDSQDDRPKSDSTVTRQEDVTLESETIKEETDTTRPASQKDVSLKARPTSSTALSADGFKVPSLPTHASKSNSTKPKSSASRPVSTAEEEEDIDAPPQFPLPDSAQRSKGPAPKIETSKSESTSLPSFNLAPPSPDKENDDSEPLSDLNIAITPGTIPLGNMAPPPSTTSRPDFGMQKGGGGLTAPGGVPQATRKRAKVALGPGYSPLDWARLTQSGRNLRGIEGPMRVTVAELEKHNTPHDAWTALDGIVYNITPYLRFHPGGAKEMLRTAGRDGTKLFMLTHSWVNYQFMLNECAIGPLVKG